MASDDKHDPEYGGSLLIDSILSQGEAEEVVSMLRMANELDDGLKLLSFYTSSQMGGKNSAGRSYSPPLSPISSSDAEIRAMLIYPPGSNLNSPKTTSESPWLVEDVLPDQFDSRMNDEVNLKEGLPQGMRHLDGNDDEISGTGTRDLDELGDRLDDAKVDLTWNAVNDLVSEGKHDLESGTAGAECKHGLYDRASLNTGGSQEDDKSVDSDNDNVKEDGKSVEEGEQFADLGAVTMKFQRVDEVLSQLNGRSTELTNTVKSLETSLERPAGRNFTGRLIQGAVP